MLFLLAIALGLALILVLLVFFLPEGQVMTTRWPNGYRRTETTYVQGYGPRPPGVPHHDDVVPHGRHRAWHESGVLAEEGAFERGVRVGEWRFWGVDGELDRERSGVYDQGVRSGPLGE